MREKFLKILVPINLQLVVTLRCPQGDFTLSCVSRFEVKSSCLQYTTLARFLWCCWYYKGLVVASDSSYEVVERCVHIDALLRTRLQIRDPQLASKLLSLCRGHETFILQIRFVSHENHGELILILDAQDLRVKPRDLVETCTVGDGEDKQETFARSHVLFPHGTELFLACRVKNIEVCNFVVDDALFTVRVLNSGIIVLHKVRLDELNGERRLTHTTSTDYHQLVLTVCITARHFVFCFL